MSHLFPIRGRNPSQCGLRHSSCSSGLSYAILVPTIESIESSSISVFSSRSSARRTESSGTGSPDYKPKENDSSEVELDIGLRELQKKLKKIYLKRRHKLKSYSASSSSSVCSSTRNSECDEGSRSKASRCQEASPYPVLGHYQRDSRERLPPKHERGCGCEQQKRGRLKGETKTTDELKSKLQSRDRRTLEMNLARKGDLMHKKTKASSRSSCSDDIYSVQNEGKDWKRSEEANVKGCIPSEPRTEDGSSIKNFKTAIVSTMDVREQKKLKQHKNRPVERCHQLEKGRKSSDSCDGYMAKDWNINERGRRVRPHLKERNAQMDRHQKSLSKKFPLPVTSGRLRTAEQFSSPGLSSVAESIAILSSHLRFKEKLLSQHRHEERRRECLDGSYSSSSSFSYNTDSLRKSKIRAKRLERDRIKRRERDHVRQREREKAKKQGSGRRKSNTHRIKCNTSEETDELKYKRNRELRKRKKGVERIASPRHESRAVRNSRRLERSETRIRRKLQEKALEVATGKDLSHPLGVYHCSISDSAESGNGWKSDWYNADWLTEPPCDSLIKTKLSATSMPAGETSDNLSFKAPPPVIPNEILDRIKAIVKLNVQMTTSELPALYLRHCGEKLDHAALGFKKLSSMLEATKAFTVQNRQGKQMIQLSQSAAVLSGRCLAEPPKEPTAEVSINDQIEVFSVVRGRLSENHMAYPILDLICPICGWIVAKPQLLLCGCCYCSGCLKKETELNHSINKGPVFCKTCRIRSDVTIDMAIQAEDPLKVREAKRRWTAFLWELTVTCNFQKCSWTGQLRDLVKHQVVCPFDPSNKIFKTLNIDAESSSESSVDTKTIDSKTDLESTAETVAKLAKRVDNLNAQFRRLTHEILQLCVIP